MPKFRYKVLAGTHVLGDKCYGPTSPNGEIFETDTDLLPRCNTPGQPRHLELLESNPVLNKMEAVPSTPPVDQVAQAGKSKAQDDGLDTQTLAELKAFAADAKIDILGLNRKDEIIAAIRRAVATS